MKILFLITLFIFSLDSNAQNQKDKKVSLKKDNAKIISKTNNNTARTGSAQKVADLPRYFTTYKWDSASATYKEIKKALLKYDSQGHILSRTYFVQELDSLYRTLYTYDSQGNQLEELNQSWHSGWKNSSKRNNIYDNQGEIQEYIFSNWNSTSNNWEIEYGERNINTYDDQGRMISNIYIEYDGKEWVNQWKDIYTYPSTSAKGWSSLTESVWKDGAWVLDYRVVDVVWKDNEASQRLNSKTEEYINNAWATTRRRTTIYSTDKNYITLFENYVNNKWVWDEREVVTFNVSSGNTSKVEQNYVDGQWGNVSMTVIYKESQGKTGGHGVYHWVNNEWQLYYAYEYTYDTQNRLVILLSESMRNNSLYIEKNDYYDFFELITIAQEEVTSNSINIFPNPAKDFISINNISNELISIKAFDMNGIEVQLDTTSQEINVSSWIAGIYYLRLITASGKSFTKKFVVE